MDNYSALTSNLEVVHVKSKKKPYKTMENTVLILITLSSMTLIIDNPLSDPDGKKQ